MGKIKIQTIFILLLLVCGLSCTDADLRPKKEVKKFIESISVQDDKELLTLIGELYNKKNKPSGRTLGTSFGEINLDKALKLNDTVFNRTRYTLGLVPTTDNFVFENIVISVREEGVFHYILRYAPDKEWLFRSPIDQNWSQYTGKITQLDFEGNIVVEATLINGQSIGKKNSGGRTSECCSWEIKYSTTTGRPYIDINCGEGGQYISYLRTSSCGGGDGGGGSAGGGSGGSGGGGYGDGGGGGGGGTGSGAGGDGGYSNPIGVFPQYKVCPGDDAQVPLDYPCPGDGMTNDESIALNLLNLLTSTSSLDQNQQDNLKVAFKEVYSKCPNKKLIDALHASGFSFKFKIEVGLSTAGGFDPATNTIKFRSTNDINFDTLQEELFHAYQHLNSSTLTQLTFPYLGRSNIEFESKVYRDVICYVTNSFPCALWGSDSDEYSTWVREITGDWTKYPTWEKMQNKYNKFLEEFIKYNPNYNFPIDYNLRPTAIFKVTNGC